MCNFFLPNPQMSSLNNYIYASKLVNYTQELEFSETTQSKDRHQYSQKKKQTKALQHSPILSYS